jgi:mRNA interferase MazF
MAIYASDEAMRGIKRGEIYFIMPAATPNVGAEIQSGRPAVIVSNDRNNKHSQFVDVVYLTTQPKQPMATHVSINATGRPSTALCEQVHTVDKSRIENQFGTCNEAEIEAINHALMVSLGLKDDDKEPPKDDIDTLTVQIERDIYKQLYQDLLKQR